MSLDSAEFLHTINVWLPPFVIEYQVVFLDLAFIMLSMLSDSGFPQFSWAHVAIFITADGQFLMQC